TLLVLPTLYNLVEGARERRAAKRAAKAGEADGAGAVLAGVGAGAVLAGEASAGASSADDASMPPHHPPRRELREHGQPDGHAGSSNDDAAGSPQGPSNDDAAGSPQRSLSEDAAGD
ncbi:MAG: hypothetical protein LBE60_12125, partial [Microbacterium sp.]|uniref:hypothetical protein n=1 Tax=Microbacterium sp. TaxID=51671 RepID=UPI00281A2584